MFSVEDLLVSHGYRVAKNSLSSYQPRTDGYQHEATDNRSGNNVTLNGYLTDREVFAANLNPVAKCLLESEHERDCVNKRRQTSSAGYPKSQHCFEACQTSETGLPDRPQTERSYWTKTDKDVQYWRRKGQDFSVLMGHGENGATVDKIISTTDTGGRRDCNIVDRNVSEGYGSSAEHLENAKNNAVYTHWKQPLEDRQENVNKNVTKDLKTSERDVSDGSSEKMLQEFISYSPGDNAPGCLNKLKLQSLPSAISPENLRNVTIPSILGDNSQTKEEKTQTQDNYVGNLDCRRSSFSKSKYSRPSKPPSYELHQQTWGAVEPSGSPDSQKDEQLSFPSKPDLPQDSCFQESGLEPPIYIPPPSYKSPPILHATSQSFNKVPSVGDCCHQNNLVGKTSTSSNKALTSVPGNNVPHGKPTSHGHGDNGIQSVQYIPFDDPRITHFAVAHDTEKQEHNKKRIERKESKNQESNLPKRERVSAFTKSKNVGNNYIKREGIKHKQWLHISIPDQICYSLPEHRDGSTACSLPDDHEPTHKLSLKKTHSDSACETVTKVKKFGPETYVQNRKSSKRRLNETIFCLVSIPVKSDSAPSEICKNNKDITDPMDRKNMLKHSNGGLHEQRLLSASSSDLELQTLTGSMNNNPESLKQAQSKKEENKQANDLRSVEQRKHRELAYSGSWPGDQYKDQQTQTVLTDIQNAPLGDGSKLNEHSKCMNSQCISVSGPTELRLPPENGRLGMYCMKGQMNLSPSSNSAFSRTHITKTEPCQRPELPNEITNGKEKVTVGKCEKAEIEDGHPSYKKEVFGQFLLKPVSRRPWDAISELESLNKEFQEQERACDGDRKVAKDAVKGVPMELPITKIASKSETAKNHQRLMEIQEIPLFEQIQGKSKLESWCREKALLHNKENGGKFQKCVKMKDNRSKSAKSVDECLMTETQVQNKKTGNITCINHFVTPSIHQTELRIHTPATNVLNDKNLCGPGINAYHFIEDKRLLERPVIDIEKMNATKIVPAEEKVIKKPSPTDRSHGVSVPDLTKQIASTNRNGETYEDHNESDVPENESLYERAARILGIDVADDNLVSTGSSEGQSPECITSSGGYQQEGKTRETFTQETPGMFNNVLHSPIETERTGLKLIHFEQGQGSSSASSPHSETNVSRSVEKRVRSTSKMIEKLQGKLATTPVHTAVDRLARMKEVHSVSRMRRLSIKSTDSGEEIDDEKQLYRGQDVGSRKFSAGAIYKRVISLDESLLITSKSREPMELSFCDSYDPARVERV
ncbi:junctional cadherin 5-associated protein [Pelodytes ibericus]